MRIPSRTHFSPLASSNRAKTSQTNPMHTSAILSIEDFHYSFSTLLQDLHTGNCIIQFKKSFPSHNCTVWDFQQPNPRRITEAACIWWMFPLSGFTASQLHSFVFDCKWCLVKIGVNLWRAFHSGCILYLYSQWSKDIKIRNPNCRWNVLL